MTLSWNASAGASSYELEAGSAPGLADVFNADVGDRATLTATAPAGTYYVRVRATNACGTGEPSNEVTLVVGGGPTTSIVINEFRTRGPSGANDEFIEIRNAGSLRVDISGWRLEASNGSGVTATRRMIPSGVVLNPGCYYLLTNSNSTGGPYSGAVPGDTTYGVGITDDGGIALVRSDGTIMDQIGMSAGSAYKEGTPLPNFGSSNTDRSYARTGPDTNDNLRDFAQRQPSQPQNSASACGAAPSLLWR